MKPKYKKIANFFKDNLNFFSSCLIIEVSEFHKWDVITRVICQEKEDLYESIFCYYPSN